MPTERFQFTGSEGHQLAAALDMPDGPIAGLCAVRALLHLRQGRAGGASASRARWRPRASRCCGSTLRASAPAKAILPTPPSPRTSPISCAPPTICAKPAKRPAILIGHSLGGAAILAAAGQIPDAKAVVTIAAPSDPAHVTGLFKDRIEDIRKHGKVEVQLAGRPFHITREFLDDIAEHEPDGAGGKAAQGAADHAFADRRHRRHRQRHATSSSRPSIPRVSCRWRAPIMLIRQARRTSTYVADVIAAWAERYVDPARAGSTAADLADSAAQGRGARNPQRQIPADRYRSVRTG